MGLFQKNGFWGANVGDQVGYIHEGKTADGCEMVVKDCFNNGTAVPGLSTACCTSPNPSDYSGFFYPKTRTFASGRGFRVDELVEVSTRPYIYGKGVNQ
jgi:hypothetical protein